MNASRLRRALIVPALMVLGACASADWPAFRHDALRTGAQPQPTALSDPAKVKKLKCRWQFPKAGSRPLGGGFHASPVIYKGQVFIGNGNGYFYALEAKTGKVNWQYPPAGETALDSQFHCNMSSFGIASSATIAKIGRTEAVIFAAPDPTTGNHYGEGHLFALDTGTGKLIWESPVIARLEGCNEGCKSEFHENLGHSSPLVLGDKVYVGVADHCDDPIQKGRVVAVYLKNGLIVNGFNYCSVGDRTECDKKEPRGGGVWSPPSGWHNGVYITTGNTRSGQDFKPSPNYGLSLVRLNAATGEVAWWFQPVPWELDGDADWSAAPTIMLASCGPVIISTQKDGWTHAVNAADGKRRWSFPPHKIPFECGDFTCHGDTRYIRSGAAWGDVYVTMNGGIGLTTSARGGYNQLHAFNVCEPKDKNRLRWVIKVPGTSDCRQETGPEQCLGQPTITNGIVYIGTDQGHLVVIADPTVAPADGQRCVHPDIPSEYCTSTGYSLVRQPSILFDIKLKGSMVYTEPALVDGRVYVSTDVDNATGYVYMLQPGDEVSDKCELPL